MKNIKKRILHAFVLFAVVLTCVNCSTDWNSHYTLSDNISAYDLMKADPALSEFVVLLEQNELVYLLKGSEVTVLAPANGSINTTGVSGAELKNLLRQHIISGRVTSDLASGKNYYASNGALLYFDAAFIQVNGVTITQQGTQKSGSIIHKLASLMNSSSKETLYGFLKKNKSTYGYIYSLYDNVTFDEKASVKFVGADGRLTYDSVFLAKSSVIDPYLSNTEFNTAILFTDTQFDEAMAKLPAAAVTAITATPAIKNGLVARTFIQSLFKGTKSYPSALANWQAVNGVSQTIDPGKLSASIDLMQNTTVMKYNDLSSNLAINFFNLLIQADEYNLSGVEGASGGANANEVISVPVFEKGNGYARRIYPKTSAANSHAFFTIGGVQKGAYVPVLNGVNYVIKLSVSLNYSMKCILWVYDQGTVDKKLFLNPDPNFDASSYFINGTLDGGMRLIEFPAQPLYTRVANNAPTFKFHADYRNLATSAFPKINGVTPTIEQTGIVIDYVEFIPVLN